MDEREVEWADLMRAANSGDNAAYERVLRLLTPALRTFAGRAVARVRSPVDAEAIVQETLIAIHLKRHTWIEKRANRPVDSRNRTPQNDRRLTPPRPPRSHSHRRP